jgi:hypothetical protein
MPAQAGNFFMEDRLEAMLEAEGYQVVQGCSTLWNAEEVEEAIEAADGGTEAILRE